MKKVLSVFFSIALILAMMTSTASAAGPLAESYWNDDPGPSSITTVDFRLENMGYDSKTYSNLSAYYIRRTMDDDAVFFFTGHGAPGRIYGANGATQMSAYIVNNMSNNYSLEAAFAGTTNELKKIRFAFYSSCQGNAYSSTYGCLTSYTVEPLDARASMGFTNEVAYSPCAYYESRLFYYLDAGENVSDARYDALSDCVTEYGSAAVNSYGLSSVVVLGYLSTTVDPAAYGS